MKKAAQYIRISDKDQANFSPEGQERHNRKWAEKNGIEIVATFIDDGRSAKNFDRPDWKKLEKFLKDNHKEVDFLIFIKYDRFSRNMIQALLMIEELEKKYRIFLEAALEPIGVPRSHPDFFKHRSQYLLDAEAEWHRIRDRTKMGQLEAQTQGYYVNAAPYGYKNTRDANDMPMLEIVPEKALIVQLIYQQFLVGHSFKEIAVKAKEKGFPRIGKSVVQRILTTPTYAGLIKTVPYRDEPSEIVPGKHEAIINKDLYYRVQKLMEPRNRFRTIVNDDFPLRGVLLCECGKPFTGAKSKGKKTLVPYYKCNHHKGSNHNANKLHSQLNDILKGLSLSVNQSIVLRELILEGLKNEINPVDEITQLRKNIAENIKKLNALEEDRINRVIDSAVFTKWSEKFNSDLAQDNHRLNRLLNPDNDIESLINEQVVKLTDLSYVYQSADVSGKQEIISTVFDRQLAYFSGSYRTPYVAPFFHDKALVLNEKRLLVYEQPSSVLQEVPRAGLQSNPAIINFLYLLKKIS